MKFKGKLEDLEELLAREFLIEETKDINYGYQIKTDGGGVVNWYPKKGTLLLQGKLEELELIRNYFQNIL